MKKVIFVLLSAVLCAGLWAQAPKAVGTDYERKAVHYIDGETNYVNSDVFLNLIPSTAKRVWKMFSLHWIMRTLCFTKTPFKF